MAVVVTLLKIPFQSLAEIFLMFRLFQFLTFVSFVYHSMVVYIINRKDIDDWVEHSLSTDVNGTRQIQMSEEDLMG